MELTRQENYAVRGRGSFGRTFEGIAAKISSQRGSGFA